MKRFLATLLIAISAACTTITPSGSIAAAYEQVRVFQVQVGQSVARGAVSPAAGRELVAEGEKARVLVDQAKDALVVCGNKLPCANFDNILNRVGPSLAEAERRMRQAEGKK